ncbi:MAG: hypothetical protein OEW22_08130 [Rubrivivax sp.]|nr:hypothetical protein [Rubrivivax sp.]
MKLAVSLCALLLSTAAVAAGPKTHLMDFSTATLMDEDTAKRLMDENIPDKVWKLYPAKRYTFLSQVEGGMHEDVCVVTARVMLLPLSPTIKKVLFEPFKTSTTFDSAPGSTVEGCKALAAKLLKDATTSVVSSLVNP